MIIFGIHIGNIIIWIAFGAIVGAVVYLFSTKKDRNGFFSLIFLGILGSIFGGIFSLIFLHTASLKASSSNLLIGSLLIIALVEIINYLIGKKKIKTSKGNI